jgi:hypothetical protein
MKTATATNPACAGCGYAWDILALDERGLCLCCVADQEYQAKLGALADKRGQYVVVLATCGNIDFGQDPNRSLPGVPKKRLRVASLQAASQACRLYIAHYEVGGGAWVGGAVIDHKTKVPVAKISYNGRAWQWGPYPQPEISLEVAS